MVRGVRRAHVRFGEGCRARSAVVSTQESVQDVPVVLGWGAIAQILKVPAKTDVCI